VVWTVLAGWAPSPPALADGASITPFAKATLGADVSSGWEVTNLPKVPRITTSLITQAEGARLRAANSATASLVNGCGRMHTNWG